MAQQKAAATLEALAPKDAKAAAIQRVWARRRPPRYAEMPNPTGGSFRWMIDTGGEFLPPEDLGEYLDDRVARCVLGSCACDVLIEILEQFRGAPDAVPDAIRLAAGVDAWAQFSIWMVIGSMPGGPAGIDTLKATISREWRKHGLQMTPPTTLQVEPIEWNRPSRRREPVEYRTPLGNPAGLAV